jgi:phosphatidylinositol-3-phosphatase
MHISIRLRRAFRYFVIVIATLVPGLTHAGSASEVAIHHVFVIVLENENYTTTFGPGSPAQYLSKTLVSQGALLTQYYGTGHLSLDNYIAMVSGQSETAETHGDCPIFADFSLIDITPDGQAHGSGCVYPAQVKTIANQLDAKGLSWKGYMEDMGNDPSREASSCAHPAIGSADPTQRAQAPSAAVPAGDQYATRHDPFMYFHAVIDSPACATHVVRLEALEHDLASISTTPNFSFITPNLCHDGHDAPCADKAPGGLVSADQFLTTWIPRIEASPAYRADGLIIITFDESSYASISKNQSTGRYAVVYSGQSCCGQKPGPNMNFPVHETGGRADVVFEDMGGDRTGAVLLSRFILPGTVSNVPYNHYALLKSLEDLFHLDGYLGYAADPGLSAFGADIFAAEGATK